MGVSIHEIIDQIIALKTMILLTLVQTAILFVLFLIVTKKFSWTGRNRRIMGLFYNFNWRGSMLMSICMMKFNLILSIMIDGGSISLLHLIFYGELVIFYIIHQHRLKETVVGLFNGIVIIAVLFAADFLNSYLKNVVYNWRIDAMHKIIIIFLLVYTAYDFVWCVVGIVTKHKEARDEVKITT